VADAGLDQSVVFGSPALLRGAVIFTGAQPLIQWKLYSGPGTITFGDSAQTNTTASFSAPGVYTLMLSAEDSVHAAAYDAVVITVSQPILLNAALVGANLSISWTGGVPPYILQQTDSLLPNAWSGVVTTSMQNATVPITNSGSFFRVQGQ